MTKAELEWHRTATTLIVMLTRHVLTDDVPLDNPLRAGEKMIVDAMKELQEEEATVGELYKAIAFFTDGRVGQGHRLIHGWAANRGGTD